MKRFFPVAVVLVLAALIPSTLSAQVSVYFDAANPPFMYEADKAPAGVYPALFSEAFKRMGVKSDLEAVPWKRAISGIDAGTNGVGGIYMNAERVKKYDYSAPFFEERLAIYVPVGKEFKYEKVEDLYGKNIGVIRGWSYGDEFDAAVAAGKIKKDEVEGDSPNFKKIAAGRVDAIIAVWESGESNIAEQKLESTVKRLPNLFSTSSVYLAFNKGAKMKDTLAKFDAAMVGMKKDGRFDAIVRTAFGK